MKERGRTNLGISRDQKTGETVAVRLNPDNFSFSALRKMVILQIDSVEPRSIFIERGEKTEVISTDTLREARDGDKKNRERIIYQAVTKIEKARTITIRNTRKKEDRRDNSLPAFRKFIEEELDLSDI